MAQRALDGWREGRRADLQATARNLVDEILRRNPSAMAMDALILLTVAFFAVLMTKAWDTVSVPLLGSVPFSWPLLIAAIPMAGFLYFGLRSSRAFFVAQLLVIVVTWALDRLGWIPL